MTTKLISLNLSILAGLLLASCVTPSSPDRLLLVKDSFDRAESQEDHDEVGNGWSTNSAARANDQKQADLNDGVLTVTQLVKVRPLLMRDIALQDGTVKLRFRFESEDAELKVIFADRSMKDIHFGFVCNAILRPDKIALTDMLTGSMAPDIREARLAKSALTEDQRQRLKASVASRKTPVDVGTWHELEVTVESDTMTMKLDDQPPLTLTSQGIAHPNKAELRLSVAGKISLDDFALYGSK